MKYIFDVDGVLCNTGCKIDESFKKWFIDWSKDKEYYLATGGERKSTIAQVGTEIVENALMGFHCMGNHIFIEDREYKINQFTLPDQVRDWLESFLENSSYPVRTSNHIEHRAGSVNFSIVGRNASLEQKLEYNEWDKVSGERKNFIREFKNMFPWFDAYIGGNASVDICLRGANKGQIISMLPFPMDEIIFFGDRCETYGIDYPLARQCRHYKQITTGYLHTKEILETL